MNFKLINKFISTFFEFIYLFFMLITGALFLYVFLFILFPENSKYYVANVLIENYSNYLDLNYYIPLSYDLEKYIDGVKDFNSIITYEYNYQTRPLYILFIKLFWNPLSEIIENEILLNFLVFIIVHIGILCISTYIFFRFLISSSFDITKSKEILILTIFLLNPVFKWGIFDSAHQTLTFLMFVITAYIIKNKNIENKKVYFYCFVIGIFSLASEFFILGSVFIIYNQFISLMKKDKNYILILPSILILLLPSILWRSYIVLNGYVPYNANFEYWNQFVWLPKNLLGGYENVNFNLDKHEFYCMDIPLFLRCYFNDLLKTIYYLSVPLIIFFINYFYMKEDTKEKFKKVSFNLVPISLIIFIFTAFIGWYPPIRLNLYSLGHLVTVLFGVQILLTSNKKIVFSSFLTYFSYSIFLNHWNSPNIIEFNNGIGLSILLTVFHLIITKRNSNYLSNNSYQKE